MTFTRAAGLGCVLLLSPALCFSAYADDDIGSSDTDPYIVKGTVDTAKGTMIGNGQTCSQPIATSSDGKLYGNIYGVTSQTVSTSFTRIDDIHTTDASHNDITLNGWLSSYYLVGAISEPSAYDSTGKASATADYNIVRVSGADSFVNFGGVAFVGVNNENDHSDDSGHHDGEGDNTGGNTDTETDTDTSTDDTRTDAGEPDTDNDGTNTGAENTNGIQSISLTNMLSSSANALNDTAAIAAVSDTADAQATHTLTASACHNTLDITGGSQSVAVAGIAAADEKLEENGSSAVVSLSADYNTLTLRGGTYNLNKGAEMGIEADDGLEVFGIAGAGLMSDGDSIKLGTLSACNNTVVLATGPDGAAPEFIGNVVLRGSTVIIEDTSGCTSLDIRGNTLVTDNVKGMTAYNLENFSNYEFKLPDMKANETVLTLTDPDGTALKGGTLTSGNSVTEDTLSFKVTKVGNLYGSDGGEFKNGDKVYLVKNENGLTLADGYTTSVTGQTGVSLNYEMELAKDENSLYLIRTGGTSVNSGTKAIAEGAAAGSALINAGSDAVIAAISSMSNVLNNVQAGSSSSSSFSSGRAYSYGGASAAGASSASSSKGASNRDSSGMDSASRDASGMDSAGNESSDGNSRGSARDDRNTYGNIFAFGYAQGSSVRHETGSSVNVSAVSLVAGLGKGFETGAGNLAVGAFFEYGKGSYTTNNSFDDRSDIDGDGNAWYMGGGIMARMDFVQTGPGHFYAEGSAHMGTLHNEYDSNDLYDPNGNVAKFDMDSPYYSLHGGLGYVWNFAEGHDLDLYGKYIWSRVQGTDDSLTTKDKFDYDDMDSNRIRLGVRYSYAGNARFSPYIGAAFEHEFSGSCDSRAYGHPVAAPSFEGSSGMGELGLVMRPTVSVPLSLNLGVQGYVGQKQGVSGNCTIMYEF